MHNVQGNHDLAPLKAAEDMSRARALKGIEKPYYSFVKGNVRFVVLNSLDYCHIPLLPFDAGDSLWNAMEVIRLIESHPSVKAVLTGHRHEGGYILRNGIHHITFKGMVQGESNRYSVVSIDTASGLIEIDGYGDEPDRNLEIR